MVLWVDCLLGLTLMINTAMQTAALLLYSKGRPRSYLVSHLRSYYHYVPGIIHATYDTPFILPLNLCQHWVFHLHLPSLKDPVLF